MSSRVDSINSALNRRLEIENDQVLAQCLATKGRFTTALESSARSPNSNSERIDQNCMDC